MFISANWSVNSSTKFFCFAYLKDLAVAAAAMVLLPEVFLVVVVLSLVVSLVMQESNFIVIVSVPEPVPFGRSRFEDPAPS